MKQISFFYIIITFFSIYAMRTQQQQYPQQQHRQTIESIETHCKKLESLTQDFRKTTAQTIALIDRATTTAQQTEQTVQNMITTLERRQQRYNQPNKNTDNKS